MTGAAMAGAAMAGSAMAGSAMAQGLPTADPQLRTGAPVDIHRPYAQELQDSIAPNLVLTIGGALAVTTTATALPGWDPRVDGILSGRAFPADAMVSIADFEGTLIDPATFQGYPYPWGSAPVYSASAGLAAGLRQHGLSMLARANGHTLDWGPEGMRSTAAALDAAGIAHAGAGEGEGLARFAAYDDLASGAGRVALVAAALGFRPTSDALPARDAAPARPGVSALACTASHAVPAQELQELNRLSCRYRHPEDPALCTQLPAVTGSVQAFGSGFVAASTPGETFTNRCEFNRADVAALLRALREARQNADFVALDLGGPPPVGANVTPDGPAPALVALAHAAVDAGAGVVAVTGGGALGPIELYRPAGGTPRPILYGTGYLYFSAGAPPAANPGQAESIIVRAHVGASPIFLEVYAVDLRSVAGSPGGSPRLADAAHARAMLERLRRLSAPFGSDLQIEAYGQSLRGRIVAAPAAAHAAASEWQ